MKGPFDYVVGLRSSNGQSGVGLFNKTLARQLALPYVLLEDYHGSGYPLFSLKFEELDREERDHCLRVLSSLRGGCALFLHTLSGLDSEQKCIEKAKLILCGNDYVHAKLTGDASLRPKLLRAFAPSLISDSYRLRCRPGGLELFYFGMATKVDRERFTKLRSRLEDLEVDYKLLCSLAVHQTSDGSCLPSVLEFFSSSFADRFIFLGNLTDMGVSYFLNSATIFIGFYRDGLRSNNTTLNTALQFGKKVITNLDGFSPPEVKSMKNVLDIDSATAEDLARFLAAPVEEDSSERRELFSWESLLGLIQESQGGGR